MHSEEGGTAITVPHLAESLVSVTVGKWLKFPGDYVKEYEVLCELETDKVNVEMPSPMEGTLIRILVQEGEIADVGTPICFIGEREAQGLSAGEQQETGFRARYSPAVLHLAEEHGVDLRKVTGTSLGGRINRKDVLAYVMNGADIKPVVETVTAASTVPVHMEPAAPANTLGDELLSLTSVRRTIAQRMSQSVSEIPHAWLMVEADVSKLVDLRERLKDRFASQEGIRLTVTPFVIKALVNAIKDFPILNSTWASDHIIVKKEIHLSIAVGSEDSVVTPVIRNADRKTIAGLAIELDDLVTRARTGKLTPADMQAGTFTFNNTGSLGSVLSFPIINYPQAAILTFESIVRRPVVIQHDMIAIRSMANLCLSLDHRILDGTICSRFLGRVKQHLEQYDPHTVIY